VPFAVERLTPAQAGGLAALAARYGESWHRNLLDAWLRYPSPATRRKRLAELGRPLAGLLAAAGGTALAGEIVAVLRGHGDDVPACLLPMLRAAGPGPSAPLEELALAARRGPPQARQRAGPRRRAASQARGLEVRQPAHAGADQDRRAVPARGQGAQGRGGRSGMARRATEASTEARTRCVTYFCQFPQVRAGEVVLCHRLLA
jgi:hypothetical protein